MINLYGLLKRAGRKRRLKKACRRVLHAQMLSNLIHLHAALVRKDIPVYLTDMQSNISAELKPQFDGVFTAAEIDGIIKFTMAEVLNQFMLGKGGPGKR
ncbi:MAG TPA: hypothetical protein VHK91_06920 [Flavisolibacter sp.]|jgi:hypothetical protein|nr:hypothetical protein [Flavisolibacter sp.]